VAQAQQALAELTSEELPRVTQTLTPFCVRG